MDKSPAKQQVFHGMTEGFEHCSAVLFGYPYFDKKPHINIYHISVRNTHMYIHSYTYYNIYTPALASHDATTQFIGL